MMEVYGDLWTYQPDDTSFIIPCITTNGFIKTNGRAVMGRGVAKEALERYPELDKALGQMLDIHGTKVLVLAPDNRGSILISFPTKYHWREKADLELISKSAGELRSLALGSPNWVFILPRPGCSNGRRDWLMEVKPIIEPMLPDNVHVITNQPYYNRS